MKKGCIIGFMIALFAIAVGLIIIYTIIYIPSGIDIDKIKYPITGIDVSKHTGKIDFQKVKEQSIESRELKEVVSSILEHTTQHGANHFPDIRKMVVNEKRTIKEFLQVEK
ncbi:MAG: hypothetical protein IPO27_13525 [Bacteroidetes bacterium]|nr:hypothetical protein [Bacteroidota bacterium]